MTRICAVVGERDVTTARSGGNVSTAHAADHGPKRFLLVATPIGFAVPVLGVVFSGGSSVLSARTSMLRTLHKYTR